MRRSRLGLVVLAVPGLLAACEGAPPADEERVGAASHAIASADTCDAAVLAADALPITVGGDTTGQTDNYDLPTDTTVWVRRPVA